MALHGKADKATVAAATTRQGKSATMSLCTAASRLSKDCVLFLLLAAAALAAAAMPASATSGPGCYRVINVESWDVLNLRAAPSAQSRIVDRLPPESHGIIAGTGACVPASAAPASRWCPVTVYDGDRITKGFAKRRYLRDSDCP